MQQFDHEQARKWKSITTLVLVVMAIIQTALTYVGLRELTGPVTSAALALVGGLFATFGWGFIYAAAGRAIASRGRHLVLLVAAALITGTGIVSAQTYFSWVGLAASPSQRHHMYTIVEEATQKVTDVRDARRREQELRPVLNQAAESLGHMAESESEHGLFSNQKTKGPIYAAIASMASAYRDATKILDQSNEAADKDLAEVEKTLSRMRTLHAEAVAGRDEEVRDVNRRFAEETLRLNKLLSELKKSSLPAVLAIVRKADAAVDALPVRSGFNTDSAAKAALLKLARESKERIEPLAKDGEESVVTVPHFKVLGREEAAFKYAGHFYQYIVYPLVLDLIFPLLGLIVAAFFAPMGSSEAVRATRKPSPSKKPSSSANGGLSVDAVLAAARRSSVKPA